MKGPEIWPFGDKGHTQLERFVHDRTTRGSLRDHGNVATCYTVLKRFENGDW